MNGVLPAGTVVAGILAMALAIQITRAFPFLLFGRGQKPSPMILYLGRALPPAIMTLLVVYCLKDASVMAYPYGLPELIGVAVVVGLHLWRRNALLSIFGGTGAYMLLVQLVFH